MARSASKPNSLQLSTFQPTDGYGKATRALIIEQSAIQAALQVRMAGIGHRLGVDVQDHFDLRGDAPQIQAVQNIGASNYPWLFDLQQETNVFQFARFQRKVSGGT